MRLFLIPTLIALLPCVGGLGLLPRGVIVLCIAEDGCVRFAPAEHDHHCHAPPERDGGGHDHGLSHHGHGCSDHTHADHTHGVDVSPCRDIRLDGPTGLALTSPTGDSNDAKPRATGVEPAYLAALLALSGVTIGRPPDLGPSGPDPGNTLVCIASVVLRN